MSNIGVIAKIKVKPGRENEFEQVFRDLQAQVRANEPGCVQYDFFRATSGGATFVVLEQYVTQDALDTHAKTQHFQAAGARMMPLLEGAPQIEVLSKIS